MTVVHAYEGSDIFTIESEGHATGSQEVCSAISALMLSLKYYLDAYGYDYESKQDDGYLKISAKYDKEALGAFKMVVTGLEALEESYPGFVMVFEGHLKI